MSSPALKNSFSDLLKQIREDYSDINFEADNVFRWSSDKQTVYFNSELKFADWSLLHELGHMLEGHTGYKNDSALVKMEVEAWTTAAEVAKSYGIEIDEEYIQDCIDSYRNWQYSRSACPVCSQTGIEYTSGHYRCINCRETWKVTANKFCRVYRKKEPGSRKTGF